MSVLHYSFLATLAATLLAQARGHGVLLQNQDRAVDLAHAVVHGGRRTLLTTGHRSDFVDAAYVEGVRSMLKDMAARHSGRHLTQAPDSIGTCGLAPLLSHGASTGVLAADVAKALLRILLSADGARGVGGNDDPSLICSFVRNRLDTLLAARDTLPSN